MHTYISKVVIVGMQSSRLVPQMADYMTQYVFQDFECRNHIRGLVVTEDHIYLCSTGAFNPQDIYLSVRAPPSYPCPTSILKFSICSSEFFK